MSVPPARLPSFPTTELKAPEHEPVPEQGLLFILPPLLTVALTFLHSKRARTRGACGYCCVNLQAGPSRLTAVYYLSYKYCITEYYMNHHASKLPKPSFRFFLPSSGTEVKGSAGRLVVVGATFGSLALRYFPTPVPVLVAAVFPAPTVGAASFCPNFTPNQFTSSRSFLEACLEPGNASTLIPFVRPPAPSASWPLACSRRASFCL